MTKKLARDEIDLLDVCIVVWKKKWIVIFIMILSLSAASLNNLSPEPLILKNKIKATTEIRPIEFYDEAKYNMFSSVIEVIAKFNSSYRESVNINKNEYVEKVEKGFNLQNDEIYNITTSITREFLLNLFIDSLNQNSYLKSAIKRFNLIKKENYSNKLDYENAVMELASSIKLLNLESQSIDKKTYIMIEVKTFEIENWSNFLRFIEEDINAEIQLKISSLFNSYINYSREIKNFKIEDIENQLLSAQTQNEISVLERKKNILLEDKYVERMINIFTRLPFSKPDEFYAARIVYDSTSYKELVVKNTQPAPMITMYYWAGLFGAIFGIFFVLVLDAIQQKRKR